MVLTSGPSRAKRVRTNAKRERQNAGTKTGQGQSRQHGKHALPKLSIGGTDPQIQTLPQLPARTAGDQVNLDEGVPGAA